MASLYFDQGWQQISIVIDGGSSPFEETPGAERGEEIEQERIELRENGKRDPRPLESLFVYSGGCCDVLRGRSTLKTFSRHSRER